MGSNMMVQFRFGFVVVVSGPEMRFKKILRRKDKKRCMLLCYAVKPHGVV